MILGADNLTETLQGAPVWIVALVVAAKFVVDAGLTIKTGLRGGGPHVANMKVADLPCNSHSEKIARLDATVQSLMAESNRRFTELRGDVQSGFATVNHRLDILNRENGT